MLDRTLNHSISNSASASLADIVVGTNQKRRQEKGVNQPLLPTPPPPPPEIWELLNLDALVLLVILPSAQGIFTTVSLGPHLDICCKAGQFYWWRMFSLGIFSKFPIYYTRREDTRRSHLHCSGGGQCTIIHCGKRGRDQAGISIPKGIDCHEARVK